MKYLSSLLLLLFVAVHSKAQINGAFTHNGSTRTFITYIPSTYNPSTPVPLVLVLHGLTMSASSIMSVTGFNNIAQNNNFIAVYPDGLNNDWNFGGTGASSTDDVGFLNALIDSISTHYTINTNRIYSCGFSAGGFMSYRMACESGRCFAAIASVSGTMGTSIYNTCSPTHLCSVMQIHGTSDFIVPYAGALNNESVDNVIQKWLGTNNCTMSAAISNLPDNNLSDLSTVTSYQYFPCNSNTEVLLYKVSGGGHQWPGTSSILGGLGTINMDINASDEIWNFFSRHTCAYANGITPIAETPQSWTLHTIGEKLFSIEGEEAINAINVYSVNGQLQMTTKNPLINLNGFAAGCYMIQIQGAKSIEHYKVIL